MSGTGDDRAVPLGKGSTPTLALRGATWTTVAMGVQRTAQTVALILLARLLSPEDFGLVAIAGLFVSFANRAKSLGLQTALLQHRDQPISAANTIFWMSGGITVVTVLVIVLASPLASLWFADPRAAAVLSLMALRLLPQAAASVPSTLAVRRLDFRLQSLITMAEGVVTAIVSITLAVLGWGVWALVAGSLTGAVVAAVLWWVRPPLRIRFAIDRQVGRKLLHSGVEIWSAFNLAYVIDSANRLFIGRFLGVSVLGLYEVTTRLVHVPVQSLLGVSERVALPAFCREADDFERLGRWLLRLTSFLTVLSALGAATLFFYADVLVPVLLGERWLAVIGAVRALAVLALLMPMQSLATIYIATGRTGLLLRFTAVRALVTIAALLAAAHVNLVAVCLVESAAAAVFVPVNLYLVSRMVPISRREFGRAAAVPAAGLAAFCAVALFVGRVLQVSAGWRNLLLPLPAVAAFALAVLAVRPRIVAEAREVLGVAVGASKYD